MGYLDIILEAIGHESFPQSAIVFVQTSMVWNPPNSSPWRNFRVEWKSKKKTWTNMAFDQIVVYERLDYWKWITQMMNVLKF